jgi:Lipocalin-like domain
MRAGAARLGCRARRAIYPTRIIRHVRRGASNATRTSTTTNPTKIPATKEEQVNLSRLLMIAAITLVGSDYAVAQSLKDQLAGTWLLVSNVNVAPDGTKRQPFGDSPKGVLILQSDGHYAAMFIRPGRPKFKANNRLQGRPKNSRRRGMARSRISARGQWSRRTLRVEGSLYPNQEGNEDKRLVSSLTPDELTFVNAASSACGRTEAVFRRWRP